MAHVYFSLEYIISVKMLRTKVLTKYFTGRIYQCTFLPHTLLKPLPFLYVMLYKKNPCLFSRGEMLSHCFNYLFLLLLRLVFFSYILGHVLLWELPIFHSMKLNYFRRDLQWGFFFFLADVWSVQVRMSISIF